MNDLFYFFVERKQVPSPKTTPKSILNNFFNFNSRVGKRGIMRKEDIVIVMVDQDLLVDVNLIIVEMQWPHR